MYYLYAYISCWYARAPYRELTPETLRVRRSASLCYVSPIAAGCVARHNATRGNHTFDVKFREALATSLEPILLHYYAVFTLAPRVSDATWLHR